MDILDTHQVKATNDGYPGEDQALGYRVSIYNYSGNACNGASYIDVFQ